MGLLSDIQNAIDRGIHPVLAYGSVFVGFAIGGVIAAVAYWLIATMINLAFGTAITSLQVAVVSLITVWIIGLIKK